MQLYRYINFKVSIIVIGVHPNFILYYNIGYYGKSKCLLEYPNKKLASSP